jgi:diguanylate cyclase (GGDEF)-like protein
MKIGDSRPVSSSSSVKRTGYVSSATSASEVREITDTASVMGIPPSEMTPKVQAAILALMQEVDNMRRELELAQRRLAELEKLADQDPLAPIANRRAFVREMSRMMSFAERYKIPISLAFLDVNGLKAINDTYGHAAGDAALVHIADMLLKNVRESDVVGRLGGDEFGIILPSADEAAAQIKAQRLADVIQQTPFIWDGKSLSVSVAQGAYSFQAGNTPHNILDEADKKMYAHKRALKAAKG